MKFTNNLQNKFFSLKRINLNTFVIILLLMLLYPTFTYSLSTYIQNNSISTHNSVYTLSSLIKTNLIAIRSYCGTSEQLIYDAKKFINSDSVSVKYDYYYSKYYYSLITSKITEIETSLNSNPSLLNNKPISDLIASLHGKQIILKSLCDSMDEITISLDRHVNPSQNTIDNLITKATSITASLNNIIESYDSTYAPFINE